MVSLTVYHTKTLKLVTILNTSPVHHCMDYEKRVRKLMFILPFFLVIGDNFENFVNFLNNRTIRNKKFQMIDVE